MLFTGFIIFLIVQRITELIIAKRNEKWMKGQGAIEFGQAHYPLIVCIHVLFFIFYIAEVIWLHKEVSSLWPILLPLFLITQVGRVWALKSLGRFWNTKIIVLPKASISRKGPYRYMKHPNYVIVSAEFIIIPMLFQAYMTAVIFTLLNIIILAIRIPAEEAALKELTTYEQAYKTGFGFSKELKKI